MTPPPKQHKNVLVKRKFLECENANMNSKRALATKHCKCLK